MFTHLHTHSHFSFGLGASSPEALAQAAAEHGFRALACTDINGVYGAVEFQGACDARGVRSILGAHLVANGQEVVALAMDERGWGALCRAVTAIHWRAGGRSDGPTAFTRDPSACPPVRLSTLLTHDRDGLILLSRDIGFLEEVLSRSGPTDLYAELRPGRRRHETLGAARRMGLPCVATNGVVAARPEDWSRHRLLRAISLNTTLSALPSDQVWPTGASLCATAELARHFPDCPEAIRASEEIAEQCRYRIPVGERTVPPRIADTGSAFTQLRELTLEGARRRYRAITPELQDRLNLELGVIAQKGFADYFLVVRDIVQHAPTHCGRGSVANSVVSYCLGITHVDPISCGLIFERFLNLQRRDPPDIDLDFPWDERDKVLAYVFQRYPRLHSAMVANHNTFQARGALREVAKVHGRPGGEIREITRRIPFFYEAGERLHHVVATHPNFRGLHLTSNWQEFARAAEALMGIPRHLSVHPGGVVITPRPLTDYVPVEPAAKTLADYPDLSVPVIQFEKDGTEDAGLVKIDLLGNRSLAVIRDAIDAVHGHTTSRIDYTSSDAGDDEGARQLFRTGQTMGVFYTESPASRLLCAKSQADTFELLVLNTSMIRPASNKYIRIYLERLRNGTPYEPLDPSLRDTLTESFGIMVYQEDVVNVCATFAGMPPATGDGLRKALSKKRPAKHLAAYAEEFFTGAMRLGRNPDAAKQVWEMIMSFSGYSFCKGHSCSYIQVAQHSCALRANHPAEFMAAVLSNGGGFYHAFAYVAEAMRMGLTVLPPDINASDFRCVGKGRELRIGLQFVKGLSADGVERIFAARNGGAAEPAPSHRARGQRGSNSTPAVPGAQNNLPAHPVARPSDRPFRSLFDFQARTGIPPSDLRVLIKVGALDSLADGWTRPMMLWLVDSGGRLVSGKAGKQDHTDRGPDRSVALPAYQPTHLPADWFADLPPAIPALKEYSPERRRKEEYEILGFMTDAHPMQLHAERLRSFHLCRSIDLHQHVGRLVMAAGMLTTAKPVHTAKEEPMEFATFDDGHGLIEAVLFPDVYRERGHVLFDQGPFIFRGKVEEEFGAVTLTLTHLDRLERRPALSG